MYKLHSVQILVTFKVKKVTSPAWTSRAHSLKTTTSSSSAVLLYPLPVCSSAKWLHLLLGRHNVGNKTSFHGLENNYLVIF